MSWLTEPETVEICDDVRGAAERATELTGRLPPQPPPQADSGACAAGRPTAVVRDLARLVDRLMGDRSAVSIELAPHIPSILADPAQLEQVLVNLCVNARDAMPDGGPAQHPGDAPTIRPVAGVRFW